MPADVSVRELRQNLSVYLRRVEAGEALRVTARGRPVALLSPLPEAGLWERLVAEGRIEPATADPRDLLPAVDDPGARSISDALEEIREDRL